MRSCVLGPWLVVAGCSDFGASRVHSEPELDPLTVLDGSPSSTGSTHTDVSWSAGGDDTREVRVAAWNLYWLAAAEGEGTVARVREDYERLARYAWRLDADVIALQEVDGSGAAQRLFDSNEYEFHFAAHPTAQRVGFAWRRGLDVVPRGDFSPLAIAGLRAGAVIEIRLSDASVELMAVHLKSGCPGPTLNDSPACERLAEQIDIIAAYLAERTASGVQTVVLGDFNHVFAANGAAWSLLGDAAMVYDAGAGHASRCWGAEHERHIDHIVLDAFAATRVRQQSFREWPYDVVDEVHREQLSDHCPISVDLR